MKITKTVSNQWERRAKLNSLLTILNVLKDASMPKACRITDKTYKLSKHETSTTIKLFGELPLATL
ncbi:MAG TPA: hypothetical protein DCE41_04035 [Cytophagales bacterium]|nr:hypothetical protein [Cytophagales bacterium]HAA20813.1 hypothetical protein [Cytophagales bacterium]